MMTELAGSVWWFVLSLGLLVTFHEYGHFIVGRLFGVRVLRFSVGFGSALLKRVGKTGTEYVLAAIPLGGYVKFLDEREQKVPAAQQRETFNSKPVWQRFLIVLAGPLFNFILCIFLLWAMFIIGKSDFAPVIAEPQALAKEAGFQADDEIIRVGQVDVSNWTQASIELALAGMDRENRSVTVRRGDSDLTLNMAFSQLPNKLKQEDMLSVMGFTARVTQPNSVIGVVGEGSAAAQVGIAPGDRIERINDQVITQWRDVLEALKEPSQTGEVVQVWVSRGQQMQQFALTPMPFEQNGQKRYVLGVSPEQPKQAMLRYGPVAAVGAAWHETWNMTNKYVAVLKRLVTGKASLDNVSGPITIARVANSQAKAGIDWFLSFMAMLSMSLCIMNLLPIPVLDGGHLMFYLVEMVTGRPVSERVLMTGQMVGLFLIVALMGLALFNDIGRLVGG